MFVRIQLTGEVAGERRVHIGEMLTDGRFADSFSHNEAGCSERVASQILTRFSFTEAKKVLLLPWVMLLAAVRQQTIYSNIELDY